MEQRFSNATRHVVLALIATSLIAGCGGGGGASPSMQMPHTNQVLTTAMLKGAPGFVNPAGFTVYVFDGDLASPGHSTCNGACAAAWPPVQPPTTNLAAPWSMIVRDDGSMQLAYAGRPLYTFAFDKSPGDTNGDGLKVNGSAFHIARPQGAG